MTTPAFRGVSSYTTRTDGTVESCMLTEPNLVHTSCGDFVPQYEESMRRKGIPSVSFYPNGTIQKLALNKQSEAATSLGPLPAEFLTFYPTGELRCIFPCNGRITGYWTEQDEAALCPCLTLRLPCGSFQAKIISLHFYKSGAVRSVTLWPGEQVVLRTENGLMPARIGFSLYENGTIESLEPPYRLPVKTPIGVLHAFHPGALGLTADRNSLSFYPDGSLRALATDTDLIELIHAKETSRFLGPVQLPDPLNDDHTLTTPLRVTFQRDGGVFLDNTAHQGIYYPGETCFRVLSPTGDAAVAACLGDCAGCTGCG